MTMPFGKYVPYFVMEGVAGDHILTSSHDVRSLPMSSPFLSQLKLNKDSFLVPYAGYSSKYMGSIFLRLLHKVMTFQTMMCLFPAVLHWWRLEFYSGFDLFRGEDLAPSSKIKLLVVLESFLFSRVSTCSVRYHLPPY